MIEVIGITLIALGIAALFVIGVRLPRRQSALQPQGGAGGGWIGAGSRLHGQPPYWPASTGWLIASFIVAHKLWLMDATSMSLYWVARLPIERPKRATSWPERRESNGQISHAPRTALRTAPRSRRQRKIALSLAVVGALVAPFAFDTYKARPEHSVWVPLTAPEKEQRANYLDTGDCNSFDFVFGDPRYQEGVYCEFLNREGAKGAIQRFRRLEEEELERGAREESRPDPLKYLIMNVGIAAATAVSLFGLLAYLIPMLSRGAAFLIRSYWSWLNA